MLEEKNKEIEQIQIERITDKKLEKHMLLVNMLKYKKCIYLIELAANLIKVGSSCQIDKRKDSIQSTFGGNGIFLDVFECDDFRDIEQNILHDPIILENRYRDKLETGHLSHEVILISDDFTYNQLVDTVKDHIKFVVDSKNFSFTPTQLLEKRKLDIIESLINNGESLSNIINLLNTPINPINQIINQPQKVIETKPLDKNVTTFKPNYGRAIQQISPSNLTRIVKLYKNMESLMEDRKYDSFSETGLRDAIKKNTIYKKYRWMIVDNDKDSMIIDDIKPTVVSKKAGCNVVLELNNDKSIIVRHFISVNTMTQELKISAHYSKEVICSEILHNNHYYIYLDDASPELLERYDTEILKYVPKSAIKIKSIHPETRQERIFPSLQHAHEFCKVHHKTLRKAIDQKTVLNGFYWELV